MDQETIRSSHKVIRAVDTHDICRSFPVKCSQGAVVVTTAFMPCCRSLDINNLTSLSNFLFPILTISHHCYSLCVLEFDYYMCLLRRIIGLSNVIHIKMSSMLITSCKTSLFLENQLHFIVCVC